MNLRRHIDAFASMLKNALVRTTVDLPDSLLRQLKARAAPKGPAEPNTLPSIRLGRVLRLPHPSNATLFELVDE